MSRKFSQFAAAMVLAAGLFPAAASAAEEIVWWAPNWGQARAEELVKKFEAANPDIKIRLEITVADGLQNRVLVALRSGSPPDLVEINNSWNVPFAATNQLASLDAFMEKSKIDVKDFSPVALETGKWKGKQYGIPYRMESHALIYNKAMYRDAGLDPEKPPTTWPELVEISKKLTRTDKTGKQLYGYGVVGGGELANVMSRGLPFIWMNGGSILSDDLTKAVIDQPAAVQAIEFYTNLYTKEGVAPPSTLQNDGLALRRLFSAGSVAQYQSGQFDIPVIRQENPNIEIGVAKLPSPEGKQPVATLGGWNFIVPAASKHQEATWKLVEFLAMPENMGFYTDTFPARISAMDLPRFQDPILKGFKEMLPFVRPAPAHSAWVKIVQIFYDRVQETLLKKATAQQAMTAAAQDIQPLLK